MEDSIDSMEDLLEERKKFRELMREILSLIRPKTARPVADDALPTDNKKYPESSSDTTDKEELLRILRNIYESCCDSIAVDALTTCEKINCDNEYCTRHEDPRTIGADDVSSLNFDGFFSPMTIDGFSSLGQNADKKGCPDTECAKPISIIIYTPGRMLKNRCRRKNRLESRNGSQCPPIRVTSHFVSSLT